MKNISALCFSDWKSKNQPCPHLTAMHQFIRLSQTKLRFEVQPLSCCNFWWKIEESWGGYLTFYSAIFNSHSSSPSHKVLGTNIASCAWRDVESHTGLLSCKKLNKWWRALSCHSVQVLLMLSLQWRSPQDCAFSYSFLFPPLPRDDGWIYIPCTSCFVLYSLLIRISKWLKGKLKSISD